VKSKWQLQSKPQMALNKQYYVRFTHFKTHSLLNLLDLKTRVSGHDKPGFWGQKNIRVQGNPGWKLCCRQD